MNISQKNMNVALLLAALCYGVWAVPTFAVEKIPDADITFWVRDALRNDPHVNPTTIKVSTEDGIVKLTGTVDNLASKKHANMEAKKIRGVVGVLDEIQVMPALRGDYSIEKNVRRRLLDSPVIESQAIHVECAEGCVTITGHVATMSEKREAELLASEVLGVKAIKDLLLVDYRYNRSDQEIKADAVSAIDRDVYLNGYPITIAVQDGVIKATGTVGSSYEKDRVYDTLRWLAGVKKVKNLLTVEWWRNYGTRDHTPAYSSHDLKEHVRASLDQDQRVDSRDILIESSDGHVTLRGTVANLVEREIAEKDTRDVLGVAWVTNYLLVNGQPREDWAIADDIRFHVKTDGSLFNSNIEVSVRNGVATLDGSVHAWWQWSHARDIALHITGVKEVVNKLKVDWSGEYSDPSIKKAVENRLTWNWRTAKISDKIVVTVRNGVAELTGAVDTWSQRKEAGLVAANTKGVWLVDNRLSVHGITYPWSEWYYHGLYHPTPPAEYQAISKSW